MYRLFKAPSFLLLPLVIVFNVEPFECMSPGRLGDSDNSGAICSQGSSPKDSILCIGKLKDRIIVLTNPDKAGDQIVYELPASSLNSSIDKLMMTTDTVTVKEKWPALHKDGRYVGMVNHENGIFNSFVVIDSQSEYLFLTTKENTTEGVVYDMIGNEPLRGVFYNGVDYQVQISSSDMSKFYALHRQDDGLKIMQYGFGDTTIKTTAKNGMILLKPVEEGDFYSMNKGDNDTIIVSRERNVSKPTLNWQVMKGFVADKKFYLFGGTEIFIFPESVYDTKGVPVHYTKVPYAEFIQCSGDVHNITNSGSKVGIIIAIVLIVLILLLCCLLWCIREAMVKKKKKHHKTSLKKGHSAPSTGSKKASQGESFKSIRSHGLKGPGNLSARMASKRSTQASTQATGRSGLGRSAQANTSSRGADSTSKQPRLISARGQSMRTRRSGLHSTK